MTTQPGSDPRVAVITGGAGGIGAAITSALRASGHRTVTLDRLSADIVCDLASEESTRAAASAVLDGYGRCDVLVHCAPELLPYVASKGALLGVMRTLAIALGGQGIAVSAVAPGLTDTPGSRTLNTDEQFDAVVGQQALKRRLVPDDTAAAVAYLASDGAAAMAGQVLCIDGGLVLR